jgi:hypothetical protein
MADIEGLSGATDTFVRFRNISSRGGNPAKGHPKGVSTIVYSAAHITFIEVRDNIADDGFVR